jgi:hypothetical protein
MAETPGKKDPSRLAIEQTLKSLGKIREQFNQRFNIGPSKSEITPKQVRLAYQNMDVMTKLETMDRMGIEQWDAHLDRIYK